MSDKKPDPARDDTGRDLAEPIPDSFDNVVAAVMRTPAKKNWRYQTER